jgi:hypothetical protein
LAIWRALLKQSLCPRESLSNSVISFRPSDWRHFCCRRARSLRPTSPDLSPRRGAIVGTVASEEPASDEDDRARAQRYARAWREFRVRRLVC